MARRITVVVGILLILVSTVVYCNDPKGMICVREDPCVKQSDSCTYNRSEGNCHGGCTSVSYPADAWCTGTSTSGSCSQRNEKGKLVTEQLGCETYNNQGDMDCKCGTTVEHREETMIDVGGC